MAETGILSGITSLGYLFDQDKRDKNFEIRNQQPLPDYLMNHPNSYPHKPQQSACADTYPINAPEYVQHQQRILSGLPRTGANLSAEIPKEFKRQLDNNQEDFANFIPANDPASEELLNLQERPITDFYHNNMVPFYGAKVTQNMAGTGVASGSYIDGSNVPGNITGVNSGFDYSTPLQTTLASFTGNDDTYLFKREVGPMFSPAEQQNNWVYGMPLFRPDMDRYTQGLNNIRNDLKPVEPIQVGPGLNLDPSIPAQGGFHEFTRILPNNVSDYKANQLPGRIVEGKFFSAGLPTSYPGIGTSLDKTAPGVTKNKPNAFWDQVRLPTMTTKVGFQNNLDYNIPEYRADFKPKNADRDQISYGLGNLEYKNQQANTSGKQGMCVNEEVSIGQGPLAAQVPLGGSRAETWMSQDNNIRSKSDCNSQPIGNPERSQFGFGNILSNWYVNETDRGTVNPQNVMQLNLFAANQGTAFWTAQDEARTTTKESTSYAYSGNAVREDQGTEFWTYQDVPKTRMAETTEFSYAGNTSRPDQGQKFWTFQDDIRTSNKETTSYAFSGNPQRIIPVEESRALYTGFDITSES